MSMHTDKTVTGDVTDLHVMPHITNSTLYAYPVADDVQKRIFMTIKRVIEDFDTSTDNADIPVEVLHTIIYNLAYNLSPEYRESPPAQVVAEAEKSYRMLKKFFRNDMNVQFVPA